jgi:hypothetical protein
LFFMGLAAGSRDRTERIISQGAEGRPQRYDIAGLIGDM